MQKNDEKKLVGRRSVRSSLIILEFKSKGRRMDNRVIKDRLKTIKSRSIKETIKSIYRNVCFYIQKIGARVKNKRWDFFMKKESRKMRKQLINDNFTILSQNCAGGYMYSLLGKRFDSPTIYLYIIQSDFCKFCADLKYYLKQDLKFFKNPEDSKCPYAHLGNNDKMITIQFTHYATEHEARKQWEREFDLVAWLNGEKNFKK